MLISSIMMLLQAGTANVLEPSSKWSLDKRESRCFVVRTFSDDPAITIGFEANSGGATIVVAGPKSLLPSGGGTTSLTTEPSIRSFDLRYYSESMTDPKLRLTKLFANDEVLAAMGAAERWTISGVRVHQTATPAALEALNRCQRELLTSWGVDPQVYIEGRTASFAGNPSVMFGANAYPPAALRSRVEGRVVALLTTSSDGKVTACKIVESPDERLNEGTCAAAMRVKISPPTDSNGTKIASYMLLPMTWLLPRVR